MTGPVTSHRLRDVNLSVRNDTATDEWAYTVDLTFDQPAAEPFDVVLSEDMALRLFHVVSEALTVIARRPAAEMVGDALAVEVAP